jgi:transposase, IS5 family
MYKRKFKQLTLVDDFYLPFGGKLDAENRWVKLANTVPWFAAEEIYANNFTAANGSPALSVRSALGALIIKETLSITDEETVFQIQENPYLQFFIGLKRFQNEAPFDSSLMTHFRKRITSIDIANVSENLRKQYRKILEEREQLVKKKEDSSKASTTKSSASEEPQGVEISPETLLLEAGPEPLPVVTEAVSDEPNPEPSEQSLQPDPRCAEPTPEEPLVNEAAATCSLPIAPPANKGKLILDATCAPADIRFPTDLGLLNDAREKTEQIIDKLYVHAPEGLKKPRTYRKTARKEFLSVAKLRVKSAKKIRNAIRKQLGCLGRNLRSIAALAAVVSLTVLNKKLYVKLLVCAELYRQQLEMYKNRTSRIDDRIVSISQPHVRPIVRGKAGAKVEFGMKLSLSVVDGWSSIEKMSWSAYNEGCDLITETQRYCDREGYYPESVHVDKIYRNRANLQWCKGHGIRLSGVPLGRPPKDPEVNAERKRQTRKDEGIRNAVEGKFGQGKRRLGMNRIMAKLAATSETVVALIVMIMNLQKLLGVHLLRYFRGIMSFLMAINGRYSLLRPKLQRLGDWCMDARFALPSKCF